MGVMHDKARLRLLMRIRNAPDAESRDAWLDLYNDSELRATEWDAQQWGFNPDKWQAIERAVIASRGGQDWPTEPAVRRRT